LFVAQSAVSQQIRRLEQQVGVALFERSTRRVALTPAGEDLYRSVAAAAVIFDGALERARATSMGAGGRLSVGIDAACREIVTPALSSAFTAGLEPWLLRWREASSDDLTAEVADKRLDLAIVHTVRAVDGVSLVPFFDDLLVAHLPDSWAGRREAEISLAELEGLVVLVGSPMGGHDRRCLALLAEAGLDPRTAIAPYGVRRVPDGHVAITSRLLVAPHGLHAVIRPRRPVRFSFAIREHTLTPALERFIATARGVCAAQRWVGLVGLSLR
jgi:DNA-binding transcriptional LysR family regulator